MRLKAQNLLEYILIFAMITIVSFAFVSKFDFQRIRNHVFDRPSDTTDSSKITIEPMTK